jgi:hypothetical protein
VASRGLYEEQKKVNAQMGGSIDPPMGKKHSEFPSEQAETPIDTCSCRYNIVSDKCN